MTPDWLILAILATCTMAYGNVRAIRSMARGPLDIDAAGIYAAGLFLVALDLFLAGDWFTGAVFAGISAVVAFLWWQGGGRPKMRRALKQLGHKGRAAIIRLLSGLPRRVPVPQGATG